MQQDKGSLQQRRTSMQQGRGSMPTGRQNKITGPAHHPKLLVILGEFGKVVVYVGDDEVQCRRTRQTWRACNNEEKMIG